MRKGIAILAGLIVLAFVNVSIVQRERLLEDGRIVLLELAPVDPRSLMQGDYMALRFKVAADATPAMAREAEPARGARGASDLVNADGRIVVTVDAKRIASYRRLDDGQPLAAGEIVLRYRVREGVVKFATNAYFFQEGTAARYESARYGEFRVAPDGDLLLTHLRGKDLEPL